MPAVIEVKSGYYPESDGKPMGETDAHRDAMVRHIELLKSYCRGQRVYVSGDLLVYYEQGNNKKFIVPDAFVVKGLVQKQRRIYKVWVEGRPPNAVIETTSKKTKKRDASVKPKIYAQIGVREYFMFDPLGEYLDPPLQGHRLVGDDYERIEPEPDGSLVSRELGLRFKIEDGELQFYRLDTGERLLTADEAREAADEAREAADEARKKEAKARRKAEAEVVRLRAKLKQTNGDQQDG